MTQTSPGGRVRVEVLAEGVWGARMRVWFDGRAMLEASDIRWKTGGVKVWDDGMRVKTQGRQAWRLPEGTRVLGHWGETEERWLAPLEHAQLAVYPHGRMARAWQEDGAAVMVFGDSPTALMNAGCRLAVGVEGGRWLRDVFVAGHAPCFCAGTPAAQRAMAALRGGARWLRGEVGQFIMGAREDEDGVIWIAGVTDAPRVWTVRLEDVLGKGFFRLTLWRDGLNVDNIEDGGRVSPRAAEVEEIFEGVTREDKPAIEMTRGGGFVARLEPCDETEFRMVKGARE